MIGIIIGATGALGICAYLRRHGRRGPHAGHCGRRGRHAHHGDHGHRGHHRGGAGRSGFGSRGAARWVGMVADRIAASPEQEEVMHDAARELFRELRSLKDEAKHTRADLGAAFGTEQLEEERMGELFARHDELLGSARKAVVGALAKIHDVLEPTQREQLSRWLGSRSGFGPYRM